MAGRPPTGYPPEITLPCACNRVSASTEGSMAPLTNSVSWSTGSRGSALRRFIDTRYIGIPRTITTLAELVEVRGCPGALPHTHSPECVEGESSEVELPLYGVLGSSGAMALKRD